MFFLRDTNGLSQSGARASIAPEVETFLGSGPSYPVPAQPESDIEVNVLLIRGGGTGHEPLLLLVSIDALYVGPKLRSLVEVEFAGVLSPHQIVISASHSHFAPMLDDTKPLLGSVVGAHFERVSKILVGCIARAIADDSPVAISLKHCRYRTNAGIYRRRLVPLLPRGGKVEWMKSQFLPNSCRMLDVESDVIEFCSDRGVVGALWVMPCHPVGYPDQEKVSGDFVGAIRTYWRQSLAGSSGPLPFIFVQGASGDLRPPATKFRAWNRPQQIITNILFGPTFSRFSWSGWETWKALVLQEFGEAIVSGKTTLSGELLAVRTLFPLEKFFEKNWEGERTFAVHLLRLGSFELLALSAELTWLGRRELLKEIGNPGMAVGGCIDDSFGYLASKSQAKWGGYEVDGFLEAFSLRPVHPRFQAIILELVRQEIAKVTNPEPHN